MHTLWFFFDSFDWPEDQDQQLDERDAMKVNQNDNKIRIGILDPDEDVDVHEEISQSKFKYF